MINYAKSSFQSRIMGLMLGVVVMVSAGGCFRSVSETSVSPTVAVESDLSPTLDVSSLVTDELLVVTETVQDLATLASTILPEVTDLVSGVQPTIANGLAVTVLAPDVQLPTQTSIQATFANVTQAPRFITPNSPIGPITPDPTSTPVVVGARTATPSGLVTPTSLPGTEANDCIYVVQSGDSLYAIAIANGFTLEELLAANPDLVGDPPVLQIAQQLNLPCESETGAQVAPPTSVPPTNAAGGATGSTSTYTVQSGDSLYTISLQFGVTIEAIVSANNLANPNSLDVGQLLIIPSP